METDEQRRRRKVAARFERHHTRLLLEPSTELVLGLGAPDRRSPADSALCGDGANACPSCGGYSAGGFKCRACASYDYDPEDY